MVRFTGIKVEDFAHPEDTGEGKLLDKIRVNAVIEWLSSMDTKMLLKTELLGKYISVSEQDMPWLYHMLREVCDALDYAAAPRIFVCRRTGFEYELFIDDDAPVIMLNDYVLNSFDEGMMRYYLGCVITCLKSKNAHLRVAAGFAGPLLAKVPVIGAVAPVLLATLVRKNVLTEDRGGLLACQDTAAALRAQTYMAGLPPKEFNMDVLQEYVKISGKSTFLVEAMQSLTGLTREVPWQNDRIVELCKWILSGEYEALLGRYR